MYVKRFVDKRKILFTASDYSNVVKPYPLSRNPSFVFDGL